MGTENRRSARRSYSCRVAREESGLFLQRRCAVPRRYFIGDGEPMTDTNESILSFIIDPAKIYTINSGDELDFRENIKLGEDHFAYPNVKSYWARNLSKNHRYQVHFWKTDSNYLVSSCTCEARVICKHIKFCWNCEQKEIQQF